MPRALITGITGQDGRYMAQLLVSKGYDVFGMVRGQNNPKAQMVQEETPALELVEGDLQDLSSMIAVVEAVQPDEVYNLGAISFVALSFRQPELTADITGLGVLRMLEAIRVVGGHGGDNRVRFYQASSSEMFGKVRETPQTEMTPFTPARPTGWPRSSATTSPSTTGRRTASTPARASASTTRAPGGDWSSSPARSPTRWPASASACRTDSPWATSTRPATGASRATSARPCG